MEEFIKIFAYLDNQTVAILIGAIIGLFIWFWRHRNELNDKYFSEYIGFVFKYLDLKQKEIDLRKAKNRRFWDFVDKDKDEKGNDQIKLRKKELLQDQKYLQIDNFLEEIDKQRVECAGQIRAKIFLLRNLRNNKWKTINDIVKKFDIKYKDYSQKPVVNEDNPKDAKERQVYNEITDCINKFLKNCREEIDKIID